MADSACSGLFSGLNDGNAETATDLSIPVPAASEMPVDHLADLAAENADCEAASAPDAAMIDVADCAVRVYRAKMVLTHEEHRLAVAITYLKSTGCVLPLPDVEPTGFTRDLSVPTPMNTDGAWRAVTLNELNIGGILAIALSSANLATLGALADYSASGRSFAELRGVGKKKAEKIAERCARYWDQHPEELTANTAVWANAHSVRSRPFEPDIADPMVNARKAGEACRLSGVDVHRNPYPNGSMLWAGWDEGWQNANLRFDAPEINDDPKADATPCGSD